ncbi:E4 SUMO-protein ligase PIAL2 [Mercurialis annua]|uniref:E4 SUMO-protein ligase PIAL2 n=1 Tax=Mercurialis annua TaxID=3986 RepID=UPI00215F60EE|nr:E4 SUMO-protein ligase PIAL2 [Mercurialis annua]
MIGTAAPAPATAADTGPTSTAGQQNMAASFANSFRIAAVADRFALHLKPGGFGNSNTDFTSLCLSLARGIDYAVANNEVPTKAQDLPALLKQVCQHKNDLVLQAAIMVLMISVKNACKIGWFSPKDSQELATLANEMGSSFCSSGELNISPNDSPSIISTVLSRFYPLMKMGQILASLEVKPGYGAYMVDFHISKTTIPSRQEKIRLFVAQKDNIETSACIISPQQVSFLLNGKGVDKRTNVSMDPGPQMPSNVTGILKYGTNLLQAVGQFNGHYIIAVAFMSVTSSPKVPELLFHIESSAVTEDPDSDVIEGPSRVSLNCPISCTRIITPVKGYSCKHLQCFDFRNFIDINSRRPSWRCPHCNQHVCYPNIRLDQNMDKVLKEVGDNVAVVIISADGSWKAVLETDDNSNNTQKEVIDCQNDMPEEFAITVDLTEDDDMMDVISITDLEDRKPSQATLQRQPVTNNSIEPPPSNTASAVDQNVASPAGDNFWSEMYLLSGTSTAGSGQQYFNQIFASPSTSSLTSPVITDAVSPSLHRDSGSHRNTNLSPPVHTQIQLMNAAASAAVDNEYGTLRQILGRNVNRTPVAVQALAASPQIPLHPQRPRTHPNTAMPNGSSPFSQAARPMTPAGTGINMASNYRYRPHHFSRPPTDTRQGSPLLQHPSSAQNMNHLQRPVNLGQPVSTGIRNDSQNLYQHHTIRMPQSRSHSPTVGRSSSPVMRPWVPIQQGVGSTSSSPNTQHPNFAATQRPVHMTRQPPLTPVQIPISKGGPTYSNTDASRTPQGMMQRVNVGERQLNSGADAARSSEQNWQPTGRMRGALSSQAVNTYKDLVIQPTQPAQTPQPQPSNLTPSPPNVSPQLGAFLSNGRSYHTPQTQNSAMSQPASMNGNSGTLP